MTRTPVKLWGDANHSVELRRFNQPRVAFSVRLACLGKATNSTTARYDIPGLAFGTWKLGKGDGPIGASQPGHFCGVLPHWFAVSSTLYYFYGSGGPDTAQLYRNETEVGSAIRDSGLAREDVFIATKYSRTDGLDIQTSVRNSLKYLGVSYLDLYLVHFPRAALPDIPTIWKEMEEIQALGMARLVSIPFVSRSPKTIVTRSIGVSNFSADQLATLLASAKVKPVANQLPILEYAAQHQIAIEAYSVLIPITSLPGGPLDDPLNQIAGKHGVTPDQVLLAWTKAKGAIVVTTSSKKSRLEGYLDAGDLALSEEDIAAIDSAGAKGPPVKLPRRVPLKDR
ncbi:NADP-dependent oxidoreductase domain-containing protein [Mycena olivaceomarginata]|nr:NADP-dependent oxidoreductase domain-containing protein [Mycena olivaceomarginata]